MGDMQTVSGWTTPESFVFLFSNKWLNKLMRRFYWLVSSKIDNNAIGCY